MSWTLVTGGAKGLGAQICQILAQEGHPLLIHYRNSQKEAEEVAAKCRKYGVLAQTLQGDFSTVESTQIFADACLKQYPDIKNIINNVGNYFIGSSLNTPIEKWMEIFQNNLHTPFILSCAFMETLKKNKGSIINIGVSGIQHIRSDVYSTAYSCAKTGLWMLTKSLAAELAPYKIKVNMVSPGYIENAVDLPKSLEKLPMGRPAKSTEIAKTIAFLLSEEAAYITGQNIEIAGGVRL